MVAGHGPGASGPGGAQCVLLGIGPFAVASAERPVAAVIVGGQVVGVLVLVVGSALVEAHRRLHGQAVELGRLVSQAVVGVFHAHVQRIRSDAVVFVVQAGAVSDGVVRRVEEAAHAHGTEAARQVHFAAVAKKAVIVGDAAVVGVDGAFQLEAQLQAIAQVFLALEAKVGVAVVHTVDAGVAGLHGFDGGVDTAIHVDAGVSGSSSGGNSDQASSGHHFIQRKSHDQSACTAHAKREHDACTMAGFTSGRRKVHARFRRCKAGRGHL